jgi:hypothetical protein
MHPPCTALAVSGNAWYGKGQPKYQQRLDAVKWTKELWERCLDVSDRVCFENPVGVLAKLGGFEKPQYIQPYQFGHPESKKTGLWLHNLPELTPTSILEKPECGYWDNQTPSGQNKLPPHLDRWKMRSKTYQGIADAMAEQWG